MLVHKPEPKIIVAIDTTDIEEARQITLTLRPVCHWFKIGTLLVRSVGNERAIGLCKELGVNVFYDDKLHDLPSIIGREVQEIVRLGADMFTVHVSAWTEALKEAVKYKDKALLVGVTVLTSLSPQDSEDLFARSGADQFIRFCKAAKDCNLDGVVSGGPMLQFKNLYPELDSLFSVVPAVRPPWYFTHDDQSQVIIPSKARELGANFLVVGRAITGAEDPIGAYRKIEKEMLFYLKENGDQLTIPFST